MEEVILIQYVDVDNYNAPPRTMAVASDRSAAMRWIQDEVDGKHITGIRYASGHDAAWWLAYGTFRLKAMEVQK